MGKTRDLFKEIRDIKGIFHEKMGSIKDKCNELVINKPAVCVGGTDFFRVSGHYLGAETLPYLFPQDKSCLIVMTLWMLISHFLGSNPDFTNAA